MKLLDFIFKKKPGIVLSISTPDHSFIASAAFEDLTSPLLNFLTTIAKDRPTYRKWVVKSFTIDNYNKIKNKTEEELQRITSKLEKVYINLSKAVVF